MAARMAAEILEGGAGPYGGRVPCQGWTGLT